MSQRQRQKGPRARVAEYLADRADELAGQWLDKVRELRGSAAFRRLSLEEAKDHVPELLASLGRDILEGVVTPPPRSTLEYLRLHVELRRDQGYNLQQVLEEFEELPALVGAAVAEVVATTREADPATMGTIYQIAYNKLAHIGAAAARVYAEAREAERRRLGRRLSEFARTLEHEIRNPLNTAVVTCELLRNDEIGRDAELRNKWVDRLEVSLQEVKELLGEIRRLSIAEETILEEQWAELRNVVGDVFANLQEMASFQDVEQRIGRLPPEDVWVRVPHVKLALRNLVANAIKYSDPAKEERWVSISCEQQNDTFHIAVTDNGLGIPADRETDEVFEPGVRAHPHTGRGSGLGLSIVREVLEQRGGSVSVESREGEGSTFRLDLPFPLSSDEEPITASGG